MKEVRQSFACGRFVLSVEDWKLCEDVLSVFDKGLRGNNFTIKICLWVKKKTPKQ